MIRLAGGAFLLLLVAPAMAAGKRVSGGVTPARTPLSPACAGISFEDFPVAWHERLRARTWVWRGACARRIESYGAAASADRSG